MKGERLNEIWCENKESILEDEHCIYNFIVSFSDAYAFLKVREHELVCVNRETFLFLS